MIHGTGAENCAGPVFSLERVDYAVISPSAHISH